MCVQFCYPRRISSVLSLKHCIKSSVQIIQFKWDRKKLYMKKEAVKMRPIASVKTESVGYNESGIGLAIAFGAFHIQKQKQKQKQKIRIQKFKFKSKLNWFRERITMIQCWDLAASALKHSRSRSRSRSHSHQTPVMLCTSSPSSFPVNFF